MDHWRFQALRVTAAALAQTKGVTVTLQMRAIPDVHLLLRVFRIEPGRAPQEHLPAFTVDAGALDIEEQIMDAIEVAASALSANEN